MTKTILEEYLPAYLNAIKTCEELEKIQDNKIKKLEKKLEIATKALGHCQGFDFVQQALKEMEDVE